MGLPLAFILFFSSVFGNPEQALFTLHRGNLHAAFDQYRAYTQDRRAHDFELLYQMCLTLLKQGSVSSDPEIQLLSCFGAGISKDELALTVLREGFLSSAPLVQLAGFNGLKLMQHDEADEIIKLGLSSQNFLLRLESIYHFCQKNDPLGVEHADIMMSKLPIELKPLFPQFFAAVDTRTSKKSLKKLLNDPHPLVRLSAIESIATCQRDDFLPDIRRMVLHLNPYQQEACANALGLFKDDLSVKQLMRLSQSKESDVALAASFALFQLGKEEMREKIEAMALEENLFAIRLLGQMSGSEEILITLMRRHHPNVQLNAALSLLDHQDVRCVPFFLKLYTLDPYQWAFVEKKSHGGSMSAWQLTPYVDRQTIVYEVSTLFLEQTLEKIFLLSDFSSLHLAQVLLEKERLDLIPSLMQHLESNQMPYIIDLLKRYRQKLGSPYIRMWCNLSLYRIGQTGPFRKELIDWVQNNIRNQIIGFRTYVPFHLRSATDSYELTPDQTSRLLIEILEAFAQTQGEDEIQMLVHTVEHGHQKNRYALVGLLMRAIQ